MRLAIQVAGPTARPHAIGGVTARAAIIPAIVRQPRANQRSRAPQAIGAIRHFPSPWAPLFSYAPARRFVIHSSISASGRGLDPSFCTSLRLSHGRGIRFGRSPFFCLCASGVFALICPNSSITVTSRSRDGSFQAQSFGDIARESGSSQSRFSTSTRQSPHVNRSEPTSRHRTPARIKDASNAPGCSSCSWIRPQILGPEPRPPHPKPS